MEREELGFFGRFGYYLGYIGQVLQILGTVGHDVSTLGRSIAALHWRVVKDEDRSEPPLPNGRTHVTSDVRNDQEQP
jgi:hypothetical protein